MRYDDIQLSYFTAALCSALQQEKFLPGDTELDEEQLNGLLHLARKQSVFTLFFDAVSEQLKTNNPAAFKRGLQEYSSHLQLNALHCHALNEIAARMSEQGVSVMEMKGTMIKELYPRSELRQSNDIDLLVRKEDEKQAGRVLEDLGYTRDKSTSLHTEYSKPGLHIELHNGSLCGTIKDYDSVLKPWKNAVCMSNGTYRMCPETFYVYNMLHFMGHAQAGGCGIRFYLDLYVLHQAYGPLFEQEDVRRRLEACVAYDFAKEAAMFTRRLFSEKDFTDLIPDLRKILCGGTYGTAQNKARNTFYLVTGSRETTTRNVARFWCYRIFPPVSYISKRYSFLNRAPFLLPVGWLMRGCSVLLHNRKKIAMERKAIHENTRHTDKTPKNCK